jgi:hypothetical protein
MRTETTGTHNERAKIYSFLGIIFFQIIQKILFSILNGKIFPTTRILTYNDINYGMPAFMTCLEAVTFSLLFHWSYSAAEFTSRPHRHLPDTLAPRLETWRAICDALDLSDEANAIWVALGLGWEGLVRWWKSEGKDDDAAAGVKRGPVGKLIVFVFGLIRKVLRLVFGTKKGKDSKLEGDDDSGVSPFDDRVAAVHSPGPPAVPDQAFGFGPGRVRTYDGHGDWEHEPRRSNGSRDSSYSERSPLRR